MVIDKKTNFLYIADILKEPKYSRFLNYVEILLNIISITYDFLPNTKDIWARDYMPIQVNKNKFVQFTYNPDYLRKYKKWQKTISDVDAICKNIDITPIKSDIIIDGGNIVKAKGRVIMCDKVFSENKKYYGKPQLTRELQQLLETDQLIFIPTHKDDEFGHADGIVRFLNDNTVLINKYSNKDSEFKSLLLSSLSNTGLDWAEIPYNPYDNKSNLSAKGIYINYLQIKEIIFVPVFEMKEDEQALKLFEQLFKHETIVPVNSNEIANEGGLLNCISWTIAIG